MEKSKDHPPDDNPHDDNRETMQEMAKSDNAGDNHDDQDDSAAAFAAAAAALKKNGEIEPECLVNNNNIISTWLGNNNNKQRGHEHENENEKDEDDQKSMAALKRLLLDSPSTAYSEDSITTTAIPCTCIAADTNTHTTSNHCNSNHCNNNHCNSNSNPHKHHNENGESSCPTKSNHKKKHRYQYQYQHHHSSSRSKNNKSSRESQQHQNRQKTEPQNSSPTTKDEQGEAGQRDPEMPLKNQHQHQNQNLLEEVLEDQDLAIKRHAATLLGIMGHDSAIEFLSTLDDQQQEEEEEEEEEEEKQEIEPPTSTSATTATTTSHRSPPRIESKPGAYAEAPGEDLRRAEKVRFSLVGTTRSSRHYNNNDNINTNSNNNTTMEEQGMDEKLPFGRRQNNRDSKLAATTSTSNLFIGNEQDGTVATMMHRNDNDDNDNDNDNDDNDSGVQPSQSQTQQRNDTEWAKYEQLLEATPVMEDDDLEVTSVAEAVDPDFLHHKSQQYTREKLCCKLGVAVTMVSCIVLALLLGLTLPNLNNRTDIRIPVNSTMAPTVSPSPTYLDPNLYLQALLPDSTLVALQNPESPQSRAMQWVLQDDNNFQLYSDARLRQRFALASIYYATGGERWYKNTNWLSYDIHECFWWTFTKTKNVGTDHFEYLPGVPFPDPNATTCWKMPPNNATLQDEDEEYVYANLQLLENNLTGTMPLELYLLTDLQAINVHANKGTKPGMGLHGALSPLHLGELTKLTGLDVGTTGFTGVIPSEVALLTDLRALIVQQTKVTGKIPTELGVLSSLNILVMDETELSGTLPTDLSEIPNLYVLWFGSEKLTGTIPSNLYELHELRSIYISQSTALTGTLATEIGQLANLIMLYIFGKFLTGTIPSQIGQLTNLEVLYLRESRLSGSIPTTLGKLEKLFLFGIRNNPLVTGAIPSELGRLPLLGNADEKSFSAERRKSQWLRYFHITDCSVTGTVPVELSQMSGCEILNLHNNYLTGPIPDEFVQLANLQQFNISGNSLSGTLPLELCHLEKLAFDCAPSVLCGCNCDCNTGGMMNGTNTTSKNLV